MPADLWLICLEDLDKETDADFVSSDQVQQPQTCAVSERAEEQLFIEFTRSFVHDVILAREWTYGLTDVRRRCDTEADIRIGVCVGIDVKGVKRWQARNRYRP